MIHARAESVRQTLDDYEETRKRILEERAEAERQRQEEQRLLEEARKYSAWIAEHETWPGFGEYGFELDERGNPRDYIRGGILYQFDFDNFEVVPEDNRPYWGFVTEEIYKGVGCVKKIALLAEVREELATLSSCGA